MADRKRELVELRERVVSADLELLKQLEARARLSREIHNLLEGDAPGADQPESEWMSALERAMSGDLSVDSIRAIFRQVRAEARAIEQPVRVAYCGPEGGFGHAAALAYFGTTASVTSATLVSEALDEVVRGRAAFAVIPFESSSDGLLQSSITALAATDLVLVEERTINATYDLIGRARSVSAVKTVFLTRTARGACEKWLAHELPHAQIAEVRTPREAAEAAEKDEAAGAIVPNPWHAVARSESAASETVIAFNLGDDPDVGLRYGVVSSRPAMRSGNDTTAVLFSVKDAPGTLFDVLRHFAERGVSLRKLHSRPFKGESRDYLFYVEAAGHVTDRPMVTALESVRRSTSYYKLLGSFPVR